MVRVAQRTLRGKSQNGSPKYVHLAHEARALEVFVDFETTSSCHAQVFGRIEALPSRSALGARHRTVRERLGQRIRGAIWQLHRIDRRRPCRQTESPHPRKHEKAHPETTQTRNGIIFHAVRIPQNGPGVKRFRAIFAYRRLKGVPEFLTSRERPSTFFRRSERALRTTPVGHHPRFPCVNPRQHS